MYFLEDTPELAEALSSMQTNQTPDVGRSSDMWVMDKQVEE